MRTGRKVRVRRSKSGYFYTLYVNRKRLFGFCSEYAASLGLTGKLEKNEIKTFTLDSKMIGNRYEPIGSRDRGLFLMTTLDSADQVNFGYKGVPRSAFNIPTFRWRGWAGGENDTVGLLVRLTEVVAKAKAKRPALARAAKRRR